MPFLHELPDWPGFRFEPAALAPLLAEVRLRHGRHLGRCEALCPPLRNDARVLMQTQEIVRSSAVEGEVVDVELVRSSVARRIQPGGEEGGARQRSVEGLVAISMDACERHDEPLSAERLCRWHRNLFPDGTSGGQKIQVGAWRTDERGPMQVISGALGHECVHFRAPPASRLDEEMRAFLSRFDAPSTLDPLIQAGVEHLWFLTIHPFEDGNGRIARSLSELRLARGERSAERFYSLSTAILARRHDYYRALESAQRASLDITAWLLWFLDCFDHAIDLATQELAHIVERSLWWQSPHAAALNERQRQVLHRLWGDFKGHLTTTKYAKLAHCSQDTALRDIQALVARGILVPNPSGGRSTSYRLAPKST